MLARPCLFTPSKPNLGFSSQENEGPGNFLCSCNIHSYVKREPGGHRGPCEDLGGFGPWTSWEPPSYQTDKSRLLRATRCWTCKEQAQPHCLYNVGMFSACACTSYTGRAVLPDPWRTPLLANQRWGAGGTSWITPELAQPELKILYLVCLHRNIGTYI